VNAVFKRDKELQTSGSLLRKCSPFSNDRPSKSVPELCLTGISGDNSFSERLPETLIVTLWPLALKGNAD
jgi:hypothetical protein